jgi:ammonia channel protein AmtB
LAPVVLVYWCGALVAWRWGPGLLLVGVAGGVVVQGVAMVAGIVIAAVIGRPVANPHL